jgi:hypothetical protein
MKGFTPHRISTAQSTISAALVCLASVAAIAGWPRPVPGQSVGDLEIRPFVVGVVPVIGPSGAVGGVSVDAKGVVARSDVEELGRLRDLRHRAWEPKRAELEAASPLRKVSLARLQAALLARQKKGQGLTDDLQCLAGLTRIRFVFVFPDQRDIVLAGPAEGWRIDESGNAVGAGSGRPVLQLDDLVVALRTARAAADGRGISCSIDPTDEGLRRLKPLLGSRHLNEALLDRMEQALGAQRITVTGVPAGSHFARVLVAADFLMKRLGMKFEPAPVAGLPSYLEMLTARSAAAPRSAMPRWWMAPSYESLLRDAEGLAWELRGQGVKTLSEEGYLAASGPASKQKPGGLAERWAAAMTSKYDSLSLALPAFAELRNCMDLALVAALLVKENLPAKAGCDLSLLHDEKRIAVAEYYVPRTVDSRASLVRRGQNWIVSLSGGVQVDSWSVLDHVETRAELADVRKSAAASTPEQWWWD